MSDIIVNLERRPAGEIRVAPSLLAADFAHFGSGVAAAIEAGADWLHFDIMDGHFVPNLSFSADLVRAVRPAQSGVPFDVHLMVERPEDYIGAFADAGANLITIHPESTVHLQRNLAMIRAHGCRAGVALNPATTPEVLRYVLPDIDLVLVMTVNPGFGGQKFLPVAGKKVAELDRIRQETESGYLISVDGGVDAGVAAQLSQDGADVLVAGSSVFHHPMGVTEGVSALRNSVRQ